MKKVTMKFEEKYHEVVEQELVLEGMVVYYVLKIPVFAQSQSNQQRFFSCYHERLHEPIDSFVAYNCNNVMRT